MSDNSAKVVVLLHPFPLSNHFWTSLKSIEGYRFIAPNFPGFGSATAVVQGYTLAQAAQDLDRQLKAEGVDKPVVLAGISMGGYWAFEYLKQYTNNVEKLLLISTRAGNDKPEGRQNRLNMAEKVEKDGTGHLPDAMTPGLLGKTTLADKPEVVAQVRKWISEATPAGVALAQRAMAARADQTAFLSQIKTQTLVIAGQEDALIPPSESQVMHEGIEGSRLEMLEKVGHLLPVEAPEKFQKLFEEFLRS